MMRIAWMSMILAVWTGLCFANPYQTPGLGIEYYVEDLEGTVGVPLAREGPYTYRLTDKITISPTDSLVLSSDTLLMDAASYDTGKCPVLYVRGKLTASNSVIQTSAAASGHGTHGIVLGEPAQPADASATLFNCRFENMDTALVVYPGRNAVIRQCHFSNNAYSGLRAMSLCSFQAIQCSFTKSFLDMLGCDGSVQECTITNGQLLAGDTPASVRVTNNRIEQYGGIGLRITGRGQGIYKSNTISSCDYGICISVASSPEITSNLVEKCKNGALTISDSATPKLRSNRLESNIDMAGFSPEPSGETIAVLPAIYIDDQAQPDFGVAGDLGNNVFSNNSGLEIYNLSTKDVQALGNDWNVTRSGQIEKKLYHLVDDTTDYDGSQTTSGRVYYLPALIPGARNTWQAY